MKAKKTKLATYLALGLLVLALIIIYSRKQPAAIAKFLRTDYVIAYKFKELPDCVQEEMLKRIQANCQYDREELLKAGLSETKMEAIYKDELIRIREESRFADPQEEFRSTCIDDSPYLPSRRMVVGGKTSDSSFIYYEHGGIVHEYILVIFGLEKEVAELKFASHVSTAKSLPELKQLLRQEKTEDQTQEFEGFGYY